MLPPSKELQDHGVVDKVIVGEAHRVFLPNLGARRAGAARFRGIRLVLTSLRPDGNDFVLNGGKIFTTFGDRADYLLVYARFCDSKGARGIGTARARRSR